MHVLIVEDDERIVRFMKRGLETEGYDFDVASSESQTIDRINVLPCDAIILDIFFGPDDGPDICRTLRRCQRAIHHPDHDRKRHAGNRSSSKSAGANA